MLDVKISKSGYDLIDRKGLLSRWDSLIDKLQEFDDKDAVRFLLLYRVLIMEEPEVDINRIYKELYDVEGYQE